MNVITKSFDYSQISDMDEREAHAGLSAGGKSEVYRRLYGLRTGYYYQLSIDLGPPPLYIQCILKLRDLGFKADPSIFKLCAPDLEIAAELMKGIKITPWFIHGGPIRQVWYKDYIHVNDNGKRTDYRWHKLREQ